jgi:glucose-6-phosphate 1-dehydrogenase
MKNQPTIIVIVGITGDLSKRKLLPAIDEIAKAKAIPEKFKIVGITRQSDVSVTSLTDGLSDPSYLDEHIDIFQMDLSKEGDYKRLDDYLKDEESKFGGPTQRLFYLSVPPKVSQPIIEFLGTSGLSKASGTKLLLEKPFGTDLVSAKELAEHTNKHFDSDQVYRIDHYLAKEMTQNLVVFRQDNIIFRKTWDREFIESISIVASEKIGIEGRAEFYEQTGALRDFVQSHMLQLAALTLMDDTKLGNLTDIPKRRLAALKDLTVVDDSVIRGQYGSYKEEVANPNSDVETFVSLTLQSSDPRWQGVPIKLATGKALKDKNTEIRITYRKEDCERPNELTLTLQPNEGVDLCLWAKKPGYDQQIEKRSLRFNYKEDERLPDAYERVILDVIKSDHTTFTTSQEILETWRILDPVQKSWERSSDDLVIYRHGSDVNEVK